ncbi:helix-turn-helix domain-containing protein [Brucella grignonensis]|uniref:hypothetical protein n=1 Tax=Brucella grignonensis TaxID=94627 RepID=UPI000B99B888|nr:hypothetical protein [Brucella grignonensis]
MSASFEKAMAAFRAVRTAPSFDQRMFDAYDRDRFAEHFGITSEQMLEIIKASRPKVNADRFQWLEAINQRHDLGVRTLRVAVALFGFTGQHGYSWPSQAGIARKAGYYPKDERSIRRSLAVLADGGYLRIIKAANLPQDLKDVALAATNEGGSGRSYRGKAYALVPPEQWPENKLTGSSQPYNNRVVTTLYNHHTEPGPVSPDSSFNHRSLSSDVVQVDTYIQGTDRDGLDSYMEASNG